MTAIPVTTSPTEPSPTNGGGFRSKLSAFVHKITTKEGWVGDYDCAWLCLPTLPVAMKAQSKRRLLPFYSLHADLPILLVLSCGLQHALAMIPSLVAPPMMFANALNLDQETQAYMISASLIGSGILSLVQMSRIRLYKGYYLGTGLLTVVGTSLATVSTATTVSYHSLYRLLQLYSCINRSLTQCTLMARAQAQRLRMAQ